MKHTKTKQVADAVAAIRTFYNVGKRVPAPSTFKETYGKADVDAFANVEGMNPDTVRKARAFADPHDGYTLRELSALCKLVEREQGGQETDQPVFGPTHLIRLISVRPKTERTALQKLAIEESWSVSRLEAEISAKFGTRRAGGRRARVATDVAGLLVQIEQFCERWRRWRLAAADAGEAPARDVVKGMLPLDVARLVDKAGPLLSRVQSAALAALTKQKPKRMERTRS